MNRREMLLGTGVLLSTAVAGLTLGASSAASMSHGHSTKKYQSLIDAALDCVKSSEACIQHCIDNYGDLKFAECAARVQEMLPICTGLSHLGAYESKHLKNYIRVCVEICADCEKACRVHEKGHPPCKACADACARCIAECNKVLA